MRGLVPVLCLLCLLCTLSMLCGLAGCGPGEDAVATLRWTAGSEAGAYGYLVYRAEDRSGPFIRVNDAVIRVPTDGEDRHSYEFADAGLTPGKTYYYYLDVVSREGVKQRFSGIQSKQAELGD